MTNLELEKTANEVRKSIVTAVHSAKAGHPGGSLSAADIFTYLYFEELNIDPKNPKMADRDRFVLSKGHTAPGLYAVLAERGFFPKEDLVTLRHTGSYLQGHPDMKHIPGIDMSVLWDRDSPQQPEWQQPESLTKKITVSMHSAETARSRKARSGKLPCGQDSANWTIWL